MVVQLSLDCVGQPLPSGGVSEVEGCLYLVFVGGLVGKPFCLLGGQVYFQEDYVVAVIPFQFDFALDGGGDLRRGQGCGIALRELVG